MKISIGEFIQKKIKQLFSLDYRSLAILRIAAGILILLDLIDRARDLTAHYSDIGTLPRGFLLNEWNNYWFISLHMASGMIWFQAALFIIAGIVALMLIFGYRTTLMSILSWALLISLQDRNPFILQGGDVVFRLTIFWLMFLPSGKMWSLDRLLGRESKPEEKSWLGIASVGYLLQIICVYVFTGLLKSGDAWHITHTAVYEALSIDQLVRPLGIWLREQPALYLGILTQATIYIEVYGPLLFVMPWKNAFFRTTGILLFTLLQVGFDTSLRVGLFGAIMTLAVIGLLPTEFWDSLLPRMKKWFQKKGKSGLTIYYDGDCGFCGKMITLCQDLLCLPAATQYEYTSATPETQKESDKKNSWIVVDAANQKYFGWQGVIVVLKHSFLFKPAAYILYLVPSSLGEFLYQRVAQNRLLVCLPEKVERSSIAKIFSALIIDIGLTIVIICMFSWNFASLPKHQHFIHKKLELVNWVLRLDQKFDMFAPTPLLDDGWYVFEGTTVGGQMVDPYHKRMSVSWGKPALVAFDYKNQRWQKYLMNLTAEDYKKFRAPYADYLCRTWNEQQKNPDTHMTGLTIYFMKEKTIPTGGTEPTTQQILWSGECGK